MNVAYKNIFKAMALFSSVQGLNIMLNLVRTKLVAMFLGPAGVGLSAIYNETKELIHESTNMGMDQSGVREISVAYERWKETGDRKQVDDSIMLVRTWVAIFSIAGILICLLFAYPISLATFGDADHTIGYMLLSPAVGMATVTCGEMAILKATRRLKEIASLSTINIAIGFFTNIPLYYFYGMKGVIPALLLFSLCQMLIVLHISYRKHPLSLNFSRVFLSLGKGMLMLGGAFVLQGAMEHGTKLAIQAFINNRGNLADVGLYTSATMIISIFLGVFASSIAVDFYPRLSGVFADKEKRALTVQRQIDVLQLFTAPSLVAFLFCLHIAVPLMLSSEFNGVIPLLQVALATCLTRSISQPMAFMPLAAGDSKMFLLVDLIGLSLMFTIYTTCYSLYGLMGIAYGICIYNLLSLLWVAGCMKVKYGVMPNHRNILFFISQTIILVLASFATGHHHGAAYWGEAAVLTLASIAISYLLFKKIRHEQ